MARTDAPAEVAAVEETGLAPREFVERFGGACRTSHLVVLPTRGRQWPRFFAQLCLGRIATVNRRVYAMPSSRGDLPAEFIRLHPWEAEYLFLVASQATRGIVEIGRLKGGSTFLLACANPRVPIWSIDKQPADDERLKSLFADNGLGANVRLLVGDSQRDDFPEIGDYDLVFVDGDHSYRGCSADLQAYFPQRAPGGHLVMHDSHAGRPQVQQAILDFIARETVETIQSPYIIASHWHTSTGSIAHFRKPATPTHDDAPTPPLPPVRRQPAPSPRPTARRTPARTPRPSRRVALAAAAVLATLTLAAPELLGDWPYNPIGGTHAAHGQPAAR
jgi:hypothetical protein